MLKEQISNKSWNQFLPIQNSYTSHFKIDNYSARDQDLGDENSLVEKSGVYKTPPIEIKNSFKQGFLTIQDIKSQSKQQSKDQLDSYLSIPDIQNSISEKRINQKWKGGPLRIIHYISRFIMQLKTQSSQMKIKHLTKKMLQLINDKSVCDEIVLQQRIQGKKNKNKTEIALDKLKNFSLKIKDCFDSIPEIEPDSLFKQFWDFLVIMMIILNIFYIPIKTSFEPNSSNIVLIVFEQIPQWVFILDIFMQFNTAYYKQGQIYRLKKDIFNNYIQTNFWFDVFLLIPYLLNSYQIPYLNYLLLLRAQKAITLIDNAESIRNLAEELQAMIELSKSVSFIIFVANLSACLWHDIGEIQITHYQSESWLITQKIYEQPWLTRYIHSIYFTTITTVTVGFGDIVPVTDAERIFVVFMTLVICGVFGYTITSIGQIFKQLSEKQENFKSKMRFLNTYLKKKKVSIHLQLQVRKYFEHYYQLEADRDEDGIKIVNQLTKNLKESVQIDLYEKILNTSKFIRETLDEKQIKKLCTYVQESKYAPEVELFKKGEIAKRLIFLQEGEVQISVEQKIDVNSKNQINLRLINHQTVLGECEFILDQPYSFSCTSTKFTQIVYFNYEDYVKIKRESQESFQKFAQLKDNILFNKSFKNYGSVCEICQWTHNFSHCPYVFPQVNTNKLQNEFLKDSPQVRRPITTRAQNKIGCYPYLPQTQESALNYILEYKIIEEKQLTDDYLESLGFLFGSMDDRKFDVESIKVKDSHLEMSSKSRKSQESINMGTDREELNIEVPMIEIPSLLNKSQNQKNVKTESYTKASFTFKKSELKIQLSEMNENQSDSNQTNKQIRQSRSIKIYLNIQKQFIITERLSRNCTSQSYASNLPSVSPKKHSQQIVSNRNLSLIQLSSAKDLIKKVRFQRKSINDLQLISQNNIEIKNNQMFGRPDTINNPIGARMMESYTERSQKRALSRDLTSIDRTDGRQNEICKSIRDQSQTDVNIYFEKEEKNSNVNLEIDVMKNLDTYFPTFNYTEIIEKLNLNSLKQKPIIEQRIKRRRSNRTLLKYSNFTRHNKFFTNLGA